MEHVPRDHAAVAWCIIQESSEQFNNTAGKWRFAFRWGGHCRLSETGYEWLWISIKQGRRIFYDQCFIHLIHIHITLFVSNKNWVVKGLHWGGCGDHFLYRGVVSNINGHIRFPENVKSSRQWAGSGVLLAKFYLCNNKIHKRWPGYLWLLVSPPLRIALRGCYWIDCRVLMVSAVGVEVTGFNNYSSMDLYLIPHKLLFPPWLILCSRLADCLHSLWHTGRTRGKILAASSCNAVNTLKL